MQVVGVFNRDGGTFRTTDMAAFAERAHSIFGEHGHVLDARVVEGASLLAELERAAGEAEMLLVGGGDGTVSAAAGVAFRSGVPLAVLPAGTMNLFARSLGVPLNLEQALAALAAGTVDAVDIATANGRPFVHQFSVGIHPKLVRLRQSLAYKSRIGKMLASARAALAAVARPPNFTAEIVTERGLERRRMAGLSVSNNPFEEGHLPRADALDRGVLGIYVVKPLSPWVLVKLAFGLLRGRFKSLPDVVDREAKAATVRFPRRKSGAVAVLDGELIALADRVDLKLHPRALKVVLPAPVAPVAVPTGMLAPA
jgi:diacylglycerol kinase family enzyme